MRFRVSLLIAMTALLGAGVSAHHSFAGTYVEGQVMRIEGTVVEFSVRNPHSFILVAVKDKDGTVTKWAGEWGSVTQLSQGGIDRFTLEVGDHLILEGAPPRDTGDHKILVRKVTRPATDKKQAWEWSGNLR
jgi:hypothetical protein